MNRYIHSEEVHNMRAPREVLPAVLRFVQPSSVLDVGCGTGTWLAAFEELGVSDYIGIDSGEVNRSMLRIPDSKYVARDLSVPFDVGRSFDLILCLEVAEHLPPECADEFVRSLTRHGDTILFSAAIPGQGGQHHLNEQWPQYWQNHFSKHGYFFDDVIRPLIWTNESIDWWYRQNIFLVTKTPPRREAAALVHYRQYEYRIRFDQNQYDTIAQGRQGIVPALRILMKAIGIAMRGVFKSKTV